MKIENVLNDNIGFIELVDSMGNDKTIVNAARTSFGKEKEELDARDIKLIKYLAKNHHDSPFRHIQLQFKVKAPEFVARQFFRHLVGMEYTVGQKDTPWNEACLSGDSKITLVSTGKRTNPIKYKIENLYKRYINNPSWFDGKKIRVYNEEKESFETSKIKEVISQGKQKTYRVTLSNKNYIDLTLSHKIFTSDGWKRLEEIVEISNNNICWKDIMIATNGTTAKYYKILNIHLLGERDCYDIEVEGPNHNLIANNVIVHNSQRYMIMEDEFYIPTVFRAQSKDNKQASDGKIEAQAKAYNVYKTALKEAYTGYKELIHMGVAKEQARGLLPISFYTQWIVTMSFQAVVNFIKLRDHDHAQFEIREYAKAMKELATTVAPEGLSALLENMK